MESTVLHDQHPDSAASNYSKPSILRTSSVASRHRSSSVSSTSNSTVASTSSPDDKASSSSPTGSITATPPPPASGRKRLSINFALPVLPSLSSPLANNSTNGAPTPNNVSAAATTANGTVPSSLRRNRSLHTHSASVSLPSLAGSSPSSRQLSSPNSSSTVATTSSPPNSAAAAARSYSHRQSASVSYDMSSASSGISSPPSSNKAASAIETYFSQLAYKERRVNDLREQIKQLEGLLRDAEEDFSEFRLKVPSELVSTAGTTINSTAPPGSAANNVGTIHPGLSTPKTALSRINTFSSSRISPPSKNSAPFSLDGAISDAPTQPYQPPNKRHSLITSPGAGLLGSSLSRSNSVSDGGHEFNSGLPLPPSKNHYQQQSQNDSSDVFNKGRKVVEEIGTQFWSFIDGHNNAPAGAPTGADNSDSGLPNLALLQQQHENPSSGGFRPTAPPRKPRRQYGGEQPQAAPVLLSMPPHNPKPQSPPSQQQSPSNPLHRRTSSGMKGPLLGTPPKKSSQAATGNKHDDGNSYYMI